MFSRKVIIITALFALISSFSADHVDAELNLARIYFEKARTSETAASNLKILSENKMEKPIYRAYNGASYAFLAKYALNPYKKLDYVHKGLTLLNDAVIMDNADIEVRFLRLAIEEHIPPAVKFTNHISSDKDYILQNLKPTHSNYSTIRGYLLISKSTTEQERKSI